MYSTTLLVFTQLLLLYFQFVSGNLWLCFKNGVKHTWQTNRDLHHNLWSHHSQSHECVLHHHHSVFCLTGPKPPPKRCLHIVRSRASYFKWEYPLLSLRSSNSFLRLFPRLLATYISPFIFPSITCFRRQFLRKMWPIQLAFRFPISRRIFLCALTLSNTYSFLAWSVQLIFSILLQHHISKLSRYFWSAARSVT